MPISVVCANCSAKLTAPDAAAGKRIKCAKCRAVCAVPKPEPAAASFEVVDDPEPEATVPATEYVESDEDEVRPQKKPRAADAGEDERPRRKARAAGDDDEDRDDERPRKKRRAHADEDDDRPRKRKDRADETKPRGAPVALIGGIVAGVLVLGFGVYWFGFRGKAGDGGPNTDGIGPALTMDGWAEYTTPNNTFKASFPAAPTVVDWKPLGSVKVNTDIRQHIVGDKGLGKASTSYLAGYIRFPDQVRPSEVEDAKNWLVTLYVAPATASGGKTTKKVSVGGREWDEDRVAAGKSVGVVRWHRAGGLLYVVGYRSENQPTPDGIEKFLDAYQVLGGDPGDPDPDPIKLDGWTPYAAPDGAFKVSFPGEAKKAGDYYFDGAQASEFRAYTVKDGQGRERKLFAGYARFPARPTPAQARAVVEYATRTALSDSATTGTRRLTVGGWPWGQERRKDEQFGGGGAVRWVQAGNAVYAVGARGPRMPGEKVLDQLFNSFEITGAKPEAKDLRAPPEWAEYRQPDGEFRALMPKGVYRENDPFKTGTSYAGVPITSLTGYRVSDIGGEVSVYVVRFRPNTAEADRKKIVDTLAKVKASTNVSNPATSKTITWAGRDAVEQGFAPTNTAVARLTHDATIGYVAVGRFVQPEAHLIRLFLDSMAFDKGPTEWVEHAPVKGGFRVEVPGKLELLNIPVSPTVKAATSSVKTYRLREGGYVYTIQVLKFAPDATEADRQKALNTGTISSTLVPLTKTQRAAQKPVTWAGLSGQETTYAPAEVCLVRQVSTATTGFSASIYAQTGTLDAATVKQYFDSFTFDKE